MVNANSVTNAHLPMATRISERATHLSRISNQHQPTSIQMAWTTWQANSKTWWSTSLLVNRMVVASSKTQVSLLIKCHQDNIRILNSSSNKIISQTCRVSTSIKHSSSSSFTDNNHQMDSRSQTSSNSSSSSINSRCWTSTRCSRWCSSRVRTFRLTKSLEMEFKRPCKLDKSVLISRQPHKSSKHLKFSSKITKEACSSSKHCRPRTRFSLLCVILCHKISMEMHQSTHNILKNENLDKLWLSHDAIDIFWNSWYSIKDLCDFLVILTKY